MTFQLAKKKGKDGIYTDHAQMIASMQQFTLLEKTAARLLQYKTYVVLQNNKLG